MASIVETVAGDRRLSLSNEEFVRPLVFGNRWNFMRIGIRYGITGTSTLTNGIFVIGVCSGTANTYKSASTVDWIGVREAGNTVANATFTYTTGPPAYFASGNDMVVTRKVNNALTIASTASTALNFASTSASIHGIMIVTLKRLNNTQMSVYSAYASLVAQVQIDASPYVLWRIMENEFTAFSTFMSFGNAATVTCGTNYDAVSVYWNQAQALEISDIMAVRYA